MYPGYTTNHVKTITNSCDLRLKNKMINKRMYLCLLSSRVCCKYVWIWTAALVYVRLMAQIYNLSFSLGFVLQTEFSRNKAQASLICSCIRLLKDYPAFWQNETGSKQDVSLASYDRGQQGIFFCPGSSPGSVTSCEKY